jgi:myo-inositol-1(or 4)-monophosphatase
VSIGLEVDGIPTVGVVVDVPRDRVYRATLGRGAWCGDTRLQTSDVRTLDEALCGTGFPYDTRNGASFHLQVVKLVLERTQGIRRAGAASLDLAMVAAGHLDLFWEFNLRRWDVCAGTILVREAGGRVSPIPGYPAADPAYPIATNTWLHDEVIALIGAQLGEGPEESANRETT